MLDRVYIGTVRWPVKPGYVLHIQVLLYHVRPVWSGVVINQYPVVAIVLTSIRLQVFLENIQIHAKSDDLVLILKRVFRCV